MFSTQHNLSGLPDPVIDSQFYDGVIFKRLIAWCIDFIIILLLTLAAVLATLGVGAFIFWFLMFCVNLAYRIFTLSRYSATVGMQMAGIEIRNYDGNKLDPADATWHSGLYTFIALFFFAFIISCIMMYINPRGQGLHDYFLGTTAINKPKLS